MIEILLALLIWGTAIEPRFILDVEHEVAELPALPQAWEGKRIGVMADWQVGTWLGNPGMVEKAVARVVEESPAAVLLVGDFLTHPGEGTQGKIERVIGLVEPLTAAGIPTLAVLGNHDYGLNSKGGQAAEHAAKVLVAALEAAGVQVLENEAVPLPMAAAEPAEVGSAREVARSAGVLYIVGVGSRHAGNAGPLEALEGVPVDAPRILMMHHPETFRRLPAGSAPVAVAGHRHGGQLRLPVVNVSWFALFGKPSNGWAPEDYGAPGNRLYINRGIGLSVLPIRLNAPPELTFFTLARPGR